DEGGIVPLAHGRHARVPRRSASDGCVACPELAAAGTALSAHQLRAHRLSDVHNKITGMLHISIEQRRVRLVRRHRLSTDTAAASVAQAAESVLALHATDPATVYLSALARCPDAGLA